MPHTYPISLNSVLHLFFCKFVLVSSEKKNFESFGESARDENGSLRGKIKWDVVHIQDKRKKMC